MRTRPFLPRPEYPRPDRQRGFVEGDDWLNLNGAWEFRFDPNRLGREERWFEPDAERWPDQIIVPFCWESLSAWGEGDAAGNDNYFSHRVYRNPLEVGPENYRSAARFEVGWYRRTIRVPEHAPWSGRRVILTVGAADFFTEAWCNGQPVGQHEGGYIPFEFDLTESLRREADGALTATIVFRVEDPMDNAEQPVGKQWGWYSSVSGIWQTVYVEPRAEHFIERFEVTTEIEQAMVRCKVFVSGGEEMSLGTTSPTGELRSARAPVSGGVSECTIALGEALLWDPTAPQLYRLVLTLHDGEALDAVHSYFGLRSLSADPVRDGGGAPPMLSLNGAPIFLRGALYQSYHPEGVYTAADTAALRNDIAAAKRAGFDLLRIHIKVDDPLLLYYADTLGILLMCDLPNFGEGGDTETGRRRYEEMLRGALARDFNHPSIVAWCLFNETWGFGGLASFVQLINPSMSENQAPAAGTKLSNESAYEWVQARWRLAKSLDPTRLVEDMSVVAWEHLQFYGHGETDVNSWHFYTDDYARARSQIADVVAQTFTGSTFNFVPGFQQGAQPLIASEYGGVGALDGDRDTSWSFKFLTNELRRHNKISAYIYTELHDVEWERNGFLNYDRTPKEFGYDPVIVNQGDVLPIDAPPIQRCEPGTEVNVEVFSSHFSRKERVDVRLEWRFSGIDMLGWVHDRMASGSEPMAFPHLEVALARKITLRMPEQTMLATLWVRAVLPDGTPAASNFAQFFADCGCPDWRQLNRRSVFCLNAQSWDRAEWNGGMSSREETLHSGMARGLGSGFFEWTFPVGRKVLRGARRITLLCEASAAWKDAPQTDSFKWPSTLRLLLNGLPVYRTILPNHPHDARGGLTYLRGGRGAYGYLCHATIEGELLAEVLRKMRGDHLRLRCVVPRDEPPCGGLTIYNYDCGRYPIGPTLIVD